VNPVRAKSSRQPAIVLDQEGAVGGYGGAKERRHHGFRIGLRRGRETDERASDRRGFHNLGEDFGEGGGVSDGQEWSDEIKRATGGASRHQEHDRSIGSGGDMSPTNGAK